MTDVNLDLPAIIAAHRRWCYGYSDGKRADLSLRDLRNANMSNADMHGANMSNADMSGANMRGANMSGANMSGANMSGALGAELAIARTRIVAEGSIIGWKRLRDNRIAKLLIPMEAKRSHAFGRKCRAEFADVLEIWNGDKKGRVGYSQHDSGFKYEVGKTVRPTNGFSENWQEECEFGIHFFITRIEAENYV